MKVTFDELSKRYEEEMTTRVVASCEFVTPCVGGLTAGEDGVRLFVKHQLKLEGDEAEKAVQRILQEEIGDRPVPSAEGELQERITYGVNVIRRTDLGPYLGNWMIHACLKTAMSRLGIYQQSIGSKGNTVEAGKVSAYGMSALDGEFSRVYLVGADGQPASTYFEAFKGRVNSPKGSVSIVHDSECVPSGTRFEFAFNFLNGKLDMDDMKDMLALAMVVGLGSVKSLGNGRFRVLEADIVQVKRTKKDRAA